MAIPYVGDVSMSMYYPKDSLVVLESCRIIMSIHNIADSGYSMESG